MLLNNAVYRISCQSVLPFLALSTLLIVTIIFNLKLEHTGFQKALLYLINIFTSFKFSHSVMSDSLWPHDPQHTRPPCPSPAPGVYPNPCPLSCWSHPTTSTTENVHRILLSLYFREELKQRIWGKGLIQESSIESLWVTLWRVYDCSFSSYFQPLILAFSDRSCQQHLLLWSLLNHDNFLFLIIIS